MAKDTFWFTHDYNAHNDDKILELRSEFGAEGYGIFWMIVESMAVNENGGIKASLIGGLSHGYGLPKDRLIAIIKFGCEVGLFYEENGFYFSKRLLLHKNERRKFQEFGQKGAQKRWKNTPPIGEGNSPPIAITGQDITIKENIITKESSHFPLSEKFNGLPDDKCAAACQLIKLTKYITVSRETISGLWGVFKTQCLTGEKFYQNDAAVYDHFINWVKDKKFSEKKEQQKSDYEKSIDEARAKAANKKHDQ